MRLEEITESGRFRFITKDGLSSDFFGQLEILDGGKGKIILSMVNPSLLPCNLGEQFNLIGNLHINNNCIFTDCFIVSQPGFGYGDVSIVFNYSLLKLDDDIFDNEIKALQSGKDIAINGIHFGIDNLDLWVITNDIFNIERCRESNKVSIICNMRDDIILYQDDIVIISVVFSYSWTGWPVIVNAKVSESPYIEINKKAGIFSIDELWSYLHKFLSLMTLLLGKQTCINSMNAIHVNKEKRSYSRFIFKGDFLLKEQVSLSWHDINFSLNDVIKLNEEVKFFSNWMTRFEKIAPSIELYETYKIINSKYSEINFLWMAQSVEALHRRINDRKEHPVVYYETMCNELRACCPKEYLTWLEPRLKYGNEISFKARLTDLLDDTRNILNNHSYDYHSIKLDFSDKKFGKFVSDIVRYRNYYTHYDPSMKNTNIDRAKKLIALSSLLELILLIQVLKFIGLTDKHFCIMLLKWHNKMGKLLRNTKFLLKNYYK